jgi:hypothetical protein
MCIHTNKLSSQALQRMTQNYVKSDLSPSKACKGKTFQCLGKTLDPNFSVLEWGIFTMRTSGTINSPIPPSLLSAASCSSCPLPFWVQIGELNYLVLHSFCNQVKRKMEVWMFMTILHQIQ